MSSARVGYHSLTTSWPSDDGTSDDDSPAFAVCTENEYIARRRRRRLTSMINTFQSNFGLIDSMCLQQSGMCFVVVLARVKSRRDETRKGGVVWSVPS